MTERQMVRVYRSSRQADMYLYVIKARGLTDVPDELRKLFGEPTLVMDMLLTPERKLARVEAAKVLAELAERGFYLQMPPGRDDYMLNLYRDTSARYQDEL